MSTPAAHTGSTTSYVVLLRGINVGGRNRLPMATLRSLVEDLGMSDPATYLQSGNLVVTSERSSDEVGEQIRSALVDRVGLEVAVIVRSVAQWRAVIAANPYPTETDGTKVHVLVMAEALEDRDVEPSGSESMTVSGSEIYLHLPDGLGRSKLAQRLGRAPVTGDGTMRNWNTVLALAELASS